MKLIAGIIVNGNRSFAEYFINIDTIETIKMNIKYITIGI